MMAGTPKSAPKPPPKPKRRFQPGQPVDPQVGRSAEEKRRDRIERERDNGIDLKLKVPIIICVALVAYCCVAMGPKEFHEAVIKIGEHLPSSLNDWFKSFHEPKNAAKDSKKNLERNTGKAIKHDWMKGPNPSPALKIFTLEDIKYTEGGRMYLVLIGHVFDVTGAEYYQPGSGYHSFIGQDASRSFVTGEFSKEALTDNLEGLQGSDYIGLANWLKFYLEHETYKFVGYLDGKYFTANREETEAMTGFRKLLKWGEEESEKEEDVLKLFPSCNIDWKAEVGTTFWCSTKSGGVDRDWSGYPREFFERPDKSPRCACVHPNFLADPRVKLYKDCSPESDTCKRADTATAKKK